MAAWLAAQDLRSDDRVVVLGHNRASFLALTLGCLRTGIVAVPLDVHLPPAALAARIEVADPAVVLAHPEFADVAAHRTPRARRR